MIDHVTRGWQIGDLVRYLMGPGRSNEHTQQQVVASWDGAPQMHQPSQNARGEFDVTDLARALELPAIAGGVSLDKPPQVPGRKPRRGPVWHCSLRNDASDRRLTDEEWAQVVTDLMDRTGIAPRGDLGACRWVAVRHADDHVHVAVMLVRQDNGRRVYPQNDFVRAREVCKDWERRYGLYETAGVDRTCAAPATRAEHEKAAREMAQGRGVGEPSRDWLRRAVRIAAVQAQDPEEFFGQLGDLGVQVRPRTTPEGRLIGYAVAAPEDVNADGLPIWYSGRNLARDLSLPQLQARWASAQPPGEPIPPAPGERTAVGREERTAAVAEATTAIEAATVQIRSGAGGSGRDTDADAAAVAHAAGDMVTAVGAVVDRAGRLTRGNAADLYDRASRMAGHGQPARWAPVAVDLRRAAWRLAAVRGLGGRRADESGVGELLVALAALVAEIAAYHEQQRRMAQAGAARHAATSLRIASSRVGGRRAGDRPDGSVGRREQRGPGRARSSRRENEPTVRRPGTGPTPPGAAPGADRDGQGSSR